MQRQTSSPVAQLLPLEVRCPARLQVRLSQQGLGRLSPQGQERQSCCLPVLVLFAVVLLPKELPPLQLDWLVVLLDWPGGSSLEKILE